MKEYLQLQYRMINRRFKDTGLEPAMGYIIVLAIFIAGSFYLFIKTAFAAYIYVVIALSLITGLSGKERNDFLKLTFGEARQKLTRITENLLCVLPFLVFLLYKKSHFPAGILAVSAVLLATTNFRPALQFAIPTPFYKKPFEFTAGFRNTIYLHGIAWLLTLIAIGVNNFNLGAFALLFSFALTLSYYTKPEDEYYVWSYNLKPRAFLFEKIKTALLFSSVLVAPLLLLLGFFFYTHTGFILLVALVGYMFLVYMVVSKYAAYPEEAGVLQGILIACSIAVPPLLLIFIPYFFFRSETRLSRLLK